MAYEVSDRYSTGSGTRQELLAAYDLWNADSQRLQTMDEEEPGSVTDDDWSKLWEGGEEILGTLACSLRETDECGHGSAEVMDDGEVVCPDCDKVWLPEAQS